MARAATRRKRANRRETGLVPRERIEHRILLVRGEKVMLDSDLAALYGVSTGALNQAVRRNLDRFPEDFRFQLSAAEVAELISQSVISKSGRGGRRRSRPHAFTEHGIAMLSSVLRSRRAIAVNIAIIRAFVRLRQLLAEHADLRRKIEELERKFSARTDSHEHQIRQIYILLDELMAPADPPPKRRIGFRQDDDPSCRRADSMDLKARTWAKATR